MVTRPAPRECPRSSEHPAHSTLPVPLRQGGRFCLQGLNRTSVVRFPKGPPSSRGGGQVGAGSEPTSHARGSVWVRPVPGRWVGTAGAG